MNKIVDRPANQDGDTQLQDEEPVLDQMDGVNPNSNESIVTYRTEATLAPDSHNIDSADRPAESMASGTVASNSIKHTFSNRQLHLSLLLVLGIVGLSAASGFLLGRGVQLEPGEMAPLSTGITVKSAAIEPSGPAKVADVQALAVLKQDEITNQLGEMRAELLRLHSIFVRLAEIAELDDGEFDLTSPLLEWQEQSSVQKMGLLNRRLAHMSDSGRLMTSIFDYRRMAYDQKISGRPLVEGHRTSGFGYRTDPITGERLEHLGLDYSGPVGEPILALADGIVTFSGKNSGYGNLVELEHVDGLRTRYAHNQANLVNRGDRVQKGEPIATLGSTGRSTGPHVHIEVRLDGSPIDPGFFVR